MNNTITSYDIIEVFKNIKNEQLIMGYNRIDVFSEDSLKEYCLWFFVHMFELLGQRNNETITNFFNGLPNQLKTMSEEDFIYMIENHNYKKISELCEDIVKYIIDTI